MDLDLHWPHKVEKFGVFHFSLPGLRYEAETAEMCNI